jgi:Tfp pilus assembly protein PilZ
LRATAAKVALIERRRCNRRSAKYPIILIVDEQGRTVSRVASTFDVSDLGARIAGSPTLAAGQSVKVILHEANREFVPCRVVWVDGRSEQAREAGLEFLRENATGPNAAG